MKTSIYSFLCLGLSLFFQPALADDQKPESTVITNITAEKAVSFLKEHPEVIIVDIRTPKEFTKGHIALAQNINFWGDEFKAELAKLDRNTTYLFHCRSGGRSTQSLAVWKELGFTKLYHLDSGFIEWTESGLPVRTGK